MVSQARRGWMFALVGLGWLVANLTLWAQPITLRFEEIDFGSEATPEIKDLCEDKQGFLWLATQFGIYRFDQYKTNLYTTANGLPEGSVRSLLVTQSGALFTGTRNGLARFNREMDRFEPLSAKLGDSELAEFNIYDLFEDKKGRIWVATWQGLFSFNPETMTPNQVFLSQITGSAMVQRTFRSVTQDSKGFLWAATSDGLFCIHPETQTIEAFSHDPKENGSLLSDNLNVVFCDSNDRIWVGHYSRGLDLFQPDSKTFKHFQPNPGNPLAIQSRSVKAIVEDEKGQLWLGTWSGGLLRMDPKTEAFYQYQANASDPSSIGDNRVLSVYIDTQGLLWVGSYLGLFKHDPLHQQFGLMTHKPGTNQGLGSNKIEAVLEDSKGRLWVGTYDAGVTLYDPRLGSYQYFRKEESNPKGFDNDGVFDILEDRTGQIWLGVGRGLYRFNETTQDFTRYKTGPTEEFITTLFEDRSGNLWVGTWMGGLRRLDSERHYKNSYRYDENGPQELSGTVIQDLFQTKEGVFWAVTDAGVDRYLPEEDRFEPLNHPEIEYVWALFEDSQNQLWAASAKGLFRIKSDEDWQKIDHLGSVFSLPCASVLESSTGELWIGTTQGLLRWHPDGDAWHLFQKQDGLQANRINSNAFKGKNGKFYFFGNHGVNSFFPEQIQLNRHKPRPALTEFLLSNKPVAIDSDGLLPKAINETQHLTLTHQQSHITFGFTALETRQPLSVQYAYRLEPFDDTWIQADANFRRATYTALPAGRYQLQIKAANDDGVWGDQVKALTLNILPPWWKTSWAYWCYGLVLFALVAYFIHSQRKKVAREMAINTQLRRVDKLKDEFLANTSHELRTPLHGIVGLTEALLDGAAGAVPPAMQKQLGMIANSGKRLTYLVNDILDFSKLKNHQLPLTRTHVDLRVVADLVIGLCRPLVGSKKLQIENRLDGKTDRVFADENRIQQIMLNLVGNAVKFTPAGTITVHAESHQTAKGSESPLLAITVTDTGPGIAADQLEVIFQPFEQLDGGVTREYGGTGIGLAITRALVELHGGELWVRSELAKGSAFTFTMPLATTKYSTASRTAQETVGSISALTEDSALFGEELVSPHQQGARILVVDDEMVNRQVLKNFLSLAHYHVTTAENGLQALELIANEPRFDLVVLDLMMPQLSGLEVCQEIRKHHSASELPVILLTAKDQESDFLAGFDAGANDYLTKPFSKKQLLKRLNTHLELASIHLATMRFVPIEFLKILEKERITDIQLGDQVQREMTVLFADMRGYTSFAESLDPAEAFTFLNHFLGRMGPEIKKHGGFVNQYYGDGIMAIFPKSALAAVHAGIDMQSVIRRYNQERMSKNRQPITVGIGIHTGPLTMGIIGDNERMDTGVVSDTVNTASRMENLTKRYGATIVLSEAAVAALHGTSLTIRQLDRDLVKGKRNPLGIYEVLEGESALRQEAKKQTMALFQQGVHCWITGEYSGVTKLMRQVLNSDPDDVAATYLLKKATQKEAGVQLTQP